MKKNWFAGLVFSLIGIFAWTSISFGAGFALYEGSARGNALGGAMVGRANDPSALFFNPAGITQLPGLQFMGGATTILPKTDVVTTNLYDGNRATAETEDNAWIPPHLYATYQFSKYIWAGFAIFSPFGLGTEFDPNWAGRYNNYNAVIKTLNFNPNIAVKVNDQFSVAAGVSAMWFDLEYEQKIDATKIFVAGGQSSALEAAGLPTTVNDPQTNLLDVNQSLNGDDFGYGFNLAIHYKPVDWMALGFSYRSEVKQELKGDADFTRPATLNAISGTETWFNDTSISGTVTLPEMLFAGFMLKPDPRLSVELGAIRTGWSSYDKMTIHYDQPFVSVPNVLSINEVSKTKNWDDVWRYLVGIEYQATDWLDIRLGYNFDESPSNEEYADYLVPAYDRHIYSLGFGVHYEGLALDVSYNYLDIKSRHISERQIADGILESDFEDGDANLIGISISYRF